MGYGLYTKFKIQYTMRVAQKDDEAIKLIWSQYRLKDSI